MPDDLSKRGPADRSRINVHEDWEVKWWCKQLGVTEQQLRDAVKAVGSKVSDVKRHLGL